jgi:hypothetical protein
MQRPRPDSQRSRIPPRPPLAVATSTLGPARRYAIYRGNDLIGTSHLEFSPAHGARVAGWFHPTSHFDGIADVFALYAAAVGETDRGQLRRYVEALDTLGLAVYDSGVRLNASVELISTWSATQHVIHVASADERLWRWRSFGGA